MFGARLFPATCLDSGNLRGILSFQSLNKTSDAIVDEYYPATFRVNDLIDGIIANYVLMLQMVRSQNEEKRQEHIQSIASLIEKNNSVREELQRCKVGYPVAGNIGAEMTATRSKIVTLREKVFTLSKVGLRDAALNVLYDVFAPAMDMYIWEIKDLIT